MINSKDNGYVFFSNSNKSTTGSSIIDFNSKTQIGYNTIDKDKFEYLCKQNTIPKLFHEENLTIKFEYNNQDIENNTSKILITKFKISKNGKKKILDTIEIEVEDNDLFFNYNLLKFFSEKYFEDKDLSFLGTKVPKRVLFNYKYGFKRTFELTKIEKINTTLTRPKDQINYK